MEEAACQSSMAENEAETARHFLRHYPAFAMLRLKPLHCHTYYEPSDLTGINISRLKKLMDGFSGVLGIATNIRL